MSQKRTVLVIDDEESVACALSIILNDSGYDATIALTGRDGLEKCDEQAFDVAITDLHLPDTSGFEVLTRIREKRAARVIIVITSHGAPDVVAEAVRLGAMGFLSKPFRPSDLLDLIERLLTSNAAGE